MGLDFSIIPEYSDFLLTGTLWTLALTALSMFFSISGGVFFAVLQLNRHAVIRWPAAFVAWLFMGTPLLLQLFLVYFGLVQIGIDLNAFVAGVIALSLHFAVYNSDIIRASIVAVDPGQTEAARSLGLSSSQRPLIGVAVGDCLEIVCLPIRSFSDGRLERPSLSALRVKRRQTCII